MPDSKKPSDDAKPAESAPSPAPSERGGATDPAVQALLAEQETARLNGDAARVSDLDKQLAALGY